jgi:hypothetical protein
MMKALANGANQSKDQSYQENDDEGQDDEPDRNRGVVGFDGRRVKVAADVTDTCDQRNKPLTAVTYSSGKIS